MTNNPKLRPQPSCAGFYFEPPTGPVFTEVKGSDVAAPKIVGQPGIKKEISGNVQFYPIKGHISPSVEWTDYNGAKLISVRLSKATSLVTSVPIDTALDGLDELIECLNQVREFALELQATPPVSKVHQIV